MKAIKIYLIVVSILLCVAIGFGIYVWYIVQKLDTQIGDTSVPSVSQNIKTPSAEEGDTTKDSSKSSDQIVAEPYVIQMSDLPETQQKVLETVGIKGDTITITAEMISCAEKAVGKERLAEIQTGTAPTAFESVKLLPCLK